MKKKEREKEKRKKNEFVYSGQVTLPEELDQLRLYRHSATAPGAQHLTLTSSSTLDRSRYLRS